MISIHSKYSEDQAVVTTRTSSLYELIEAVNSSINPGEEDMVPLIVSHLLSSCNATLEQP